MSPASSSPPPRVSAIIVAAGFGRRFGDDDGPPKQLRLLAGRPVIWHAWDVCRRRPEIDEIVVVAPPEHQEAVSAALKATAADKTTVTPGGRSRAESVHLGLLKTAGALVLVHDGVRPLIDGDQVSRCLAAAREVGAAILARPTQETLKRVDEKNRVELTVDRSKIWQAQTPQVFQRSVLEEALAMARATGYQATDEAALVEALGRPVAVVAGSARNLKITTPEDLEMAEALLANQPVWRVGHGYDCHRLTPGRPLFLGCLRLPSKFGLAGHSDADVLAHALADALLGAAALGDLGVHFSDQEPRWAGLAGAELLARTMAMVRAAGFELNNADLTLIGEKPKIAPHREAMRQALAEALGAPLAAVSLKATTTEGLGPEGRGEGLSASAVVLLKGRAEP